MKPKLATYPQTTGKPSGKVRSLSATSLSAWPTMPPNALPQSIGNNGVPKWGFQGERPTSLPKPQWREVRPETGRPLAVVEADVLSKGGIWSIFRFPDDTYGAALAYSGTAFVLRQMTKWFVADYGLPKAA